MKALRFYGKRDFRYEDAPEPSPGPGQVKIKVSLAGICGTELSDYIKGFYGNFKTNVILGHEYVGKVVGLGEGVSGWETGDRVVGMCYRSCGECYFCKKARYNLCLQKGQLGKTVDGCMAEYMVAPANSLLRLPDSVSDELGAVVEPLAVGLHTVNQGKVGPGDKIAIIGDGPLGLCTLLAARAAGAAEIYMVSKHKRRGEVAAAMGAAQVIYLNEDPLRKITDYTGGTGVDVSFVCVGNDDAPLLAMDLTRRGGTTVIAAVGSSDTAPVSVRGIYSFEKYLAGASSSVIQDFAVVVALLAARRIDPSPMITTRVPLQDAAEKGFEALLADKESHIKVLIQIP